MASKKRIFIKKSQRVKRNKAERNKKPVERSKKPVIKDDKQEYINKWDKEQQEWARTFNHKENEE